MLRTNTFIGTDGWGYDHPILGSLGIKNKLVGMLSSHREQFLRDIYGGVPIGIDFKTTFSALEEMPISAVGLADIPTPATSLTCIGGINLCYSDSFLIGNLFEYIEEHPERPTVEFAVDSSSEVDIVPNMFNVLDSNYRVILAGEVNDFVGDLIASCFDEHRLISFESFEFLFSFCRYVAVALKLTSPYFNISYLSNDVLTKVELSERFVPEWVIDGDGCKVTNIYIHTEYGVVFTSQNNLFGENRLDSDRIIFKVNHYGIASPFTHEMFIEPIPEPIWNYGDCQPTIVSGNCDYRVAFISNSKRENAIIESDWNISHSFRFLKVVDLPSCSLNNISWKVSNFPMVMVSEVVQIG